MTTDISIDIETASTQDNAAVVQIGVAHMKGGEILDQDGLNVKIDVTEYQQEQYKPFFDVDIGTMLWWATQSSEARVAAFGAVNPHNIDINAERVPLQTAMQTLYYNIECVKGKKRIWAKPPQFDIVILRNAFKRVSIKVPWNFREERCLRTLLSMTPKDASIHGMPFDGAQHDAYVDAVRQLKQIRACLTVAGRMRDGK